MGREVFLSDGLRERLKQARHALTPDRGGYVSLEKLAAEVGVSGVTLGNYESGATEPDLAMIERLAAVLHVPPAVLAFGEGGAAVHEPYSPLEAEGKRPADPRARGKKASKKKPRQKEA